MQQPTTTIINILPHGFFYCYFYLFPIMTILYILYFYTSLLSLLLLLLFFIIYIFIVYVRISICNTPPFYLYEHHLFQVTIS
jgi:hypothetical protein